ncbi:MAG: TolC family protein [Bacteroidia bacterium]|nr:TolC family protein [Bacteroidia bacterium]
MIKRSLIIIIAGLSFSARAQTTPADTLPMSLKESVDYALQHSVIMQNTKADIAYAQQQVKETTAIGIPTVKGSLTFQDATQLPIFVIPNFTNPAAGTQALRVGNKYTTIAAINANWLAVDGSFFIGLKASKQFTELAARVSAKSENDVKLDVIKTYFLVLITKENVKLLDDNIQTLKSIFDNTSALNKEGFTEQLDVDRLELQLSNLTIQRSKLIDQLDVVLNLLKAKMGMPIDNPIKLTDNLKELYESFNKADAAAAADNIRLRPEYMILEQQVVLNKLDKQRFEYSRYPNLVAFANYQQANYQNEIKYKTWYSSSYIGASINVPIFTGFANNAKIQKSSISLDKSTNNLNDFENIAKLQVLQNRQKYIRAQEILAQQEKNLKLANSILTTTSIKYKEGVGSNIEVVTANQDLKTSQANYLNAIFDLLNTNLDLQQSLGQTITY